MFSSLRVVSRSAGSLRSAVSRTSTNGCASVLGSFSAVKNVIAARSYGVQLNREVADAIKETDKGLISALKVEIEDAIAPVEDEDVEVSHEKMEEACLKYLKEYNPFDFKVDTLPGLKSVVLKSNQGEQDVYVKFDAVRSEIEGADAFAPYNNEESATEEGFEEGYNTQEKSFPIVITIKNNAQGNALMFNCQTADGKLEILNITNVPMAASEEETEQVTHGEVSLDIYDGPNCDELSEELTDKLYDYLVVRGIDERFLSFCADYRIYKEEKEYRRWLKDLTAFVQKKTIEM
eukprot:Nk52_evm34s226 gene=Nk52_evmTU34s226